MIPNSKQKSVFPRSNDWSFISVWNESLGGKTERPTQARDRLWASELGKPNIELFLKMRGVEATNPPNQRSKRKFEAGNVFEWLVSLILKRAGILKETQKWVAYQYPGLLQVSGKIDFIAGGMPDYEHWKEKLDALELPDVFMRVSADIIKHFQEKYPEGLADMYLEIKSCSSFMMDSMERTKKSSRNHRLQLFHYLKAENYPNGRVVYICRDDLRMLEIPVKNPSEVEDEYKKAISEVTAFYDAHKDTPLEKFLVKPNLPEGVPTEGMPPEMLKWTWIPLEGLPPLEKFVVWDDDLQKFARNWGVEYSSYLTMLYGFQTQLQFEELVNPQVARWNRVLSRMKRGKSRAGWLESNRATEEDVQKEKIPGKRNGRQFVVKFSKESGQEVVYVPDELASGYEMTDKNLAVIEEIRQAGFVVEDLVDKFVGEVVEEEINA